MDTQQSEIESRLEASIEGKVVSRYALASDADLHAVHAMLARVCRESKRFAMVEVKGEEDGSE